MSNRKVNPTKLANTLSPMATNRKKIVTGEELQNFPLSLKASGW